MEKAINKTYSLETDQKKEPSMRCADKLLVILPKAQKCKLWLTITLVTKSQVT